MKNKNLINRLKAGVVSSALFVSALFSGCGKDDPGPDPYAPPQPPVAKVDTVSVSITSVSAAVNSDLKQKLSADNKYYQISAGDNFGLQKSDFAAADEMLDILAEFGAEHKGVFAWNGKFVHAAENEVLLDAGDCDILRRMPVGTGDNGFMFNIPKDQTNKFSEEQLKSLTTVDPNLIIITNLKEFSEKIREANRRARAGEFVKVRFSKSADGTPITFDADSLETLRLLESPRISVAGGDGHLRAQLKTYPTYSYTLNSVHVLKNNENVKVEIELMSPEECHSRGGYPWPVEYGISVPAFHNDTTMNLYRTASTMDQQDYVGTFIQNGKPVDPLVSDFRPSGGETSGFGDYGAGYQKEEADIKNIYYDTYGGANGSGIKL